MEKIKPVYAPKDFFEVITCSANVVAKSPPEYLSPWTVIDVNFAKICRCIIIY